MVKNDLKWLMWAKDRAKWVKVDHKRAKFEGKRVKTEAVRSFAGARMHTHKLAYGTHGLRVAVAVLGNVGTPRRDLRMLPTGCEQEWDL